MLRLHDTATGAPAEIFLREAGKVSMYVCGPTVDNVPHIGHGRTSLVFDVLRRYLEWCGLEVSFVSNVTDIDDKIIKRARAEGREASDLAAEQEAGWWAAIERLGVRRPSAVPHATAYVPDMLRLIGELLDRGFAYQTADGVYLDVSRVGDYGLLARQPLDSLRAGARVEADEDKRSHLDFALWKAAKPGEPRWDSPWGAGRPGWHTECVVMSLDLLGEGFDIHGGGLDLAFPHHENERAQAVALGRRFARHWVHGGMVEVAGEKMSKSLGNFTSLVDLLDRTDARAYRLLVLRAHYRKPLEVTPETLEDAAEGLGRLDALARRFRLGGRNRVEELRDSLDTGAVERFRDRMDDDLDTAGALAVVFDLTRGANAADDAGDEALGERLARTVAHLSAAVGLVLAGDDEKVDEAVAALVAERDRARARRDFTEADAIREDLEVQGWVVEDTASGTKVRRRSRGDLSGDAR